MNHNVPNEMICPFCLEFDLNAQNDYNKRQHKEALILMKKYQLRLKKSESPKKKEAKLENCLIKKNNRKIKCYLKGFKIWIKIFYQLA